MTSHDLVVFTRTPASDEGAEIISLVRLPLGTRPTPMVVLDYEDVERCRDLDCPDYAACLSFSAEVRWKSFHCRQCPRQDKSVAEPSIRRPVLLQLARR